MGARHRSAKKGVSVETGHDAPPCMSQTRWRIPLKEWKVNGRETRNLPEVLAQVGRSGGWEVSGSARAAW